MKTTVENLSPTRVRLTIEVPFDELEPTVAEVYKRVGAQVRVPGFRPGKVPARIIDQRVGRAVVLEEVVQHAVPKFYSEAVRENEVQVLGPARGRGHRARRRRAARLHRRGRRRGPQLELPDLASVSVTVDDVEVTDEEIDEQVSALRDRFAMLVPRRPRRARTATTSPSTSWRGSTGRSLEGGDDQRPVLRGRHRQADARPRRGRARAVRRREPHLLHDPGRGSAGRRGRRRHGHRPLGQGQGAPRARRRLRLLASEFDTLEELRDDIRTRLDAGARAGAGGSRPATRCSRR